MLGELKNSAWQVPTQDLKYVMNVRVHEDAKLSPKDFLERVNCVLAIRAKWIKEGISWYPANAREWNLLAHLHAAVRVGDFAYVGSRSDYKYFGLFLPRLQYEWLNNNDLGVLQRQIVAFLAGMYSRDSNAKRSLIREQVYAPVYAEIESAVRSYFDPSQASQLNEQEFAAYYIEQFKAFTGAPPPTFLRSSQPEPPQELASAWGCQTEFHLGYGEFYMSDLDWKRIVEKNEYDKLLRTEADGGLWQRWKHTFELSHSGGSHVFDIFATPSAKGYVYLIQQGESDLYKIGWTADSDINRRLSALQTASAHPLSIVGAFSVSSRQTELTLHRLFAYFKQRGEWFRLTREQVTQLLDEQWRTEQQIF